MRFQQTNTSRVPESVLEIINLDAIKKRQERFGEVTRETEHLLQRSEQEEKSRKRTERFGNVSEDILRKRRLERFDMK